MFDCFYVLSVDWVSIDFQYKPYIFHTLTYQDDANHDPQWSYEQVVCAAMKCGGRVIGGAEIDAIVRTAACVFEVLEHLWNKQECSLIDMKIEFGIDCQTR